MSREIVAVETVAASIASELALAATDPAIEAGFAGAHTQRQLYAEDLRAMSPYLPELPDGEVTETYERIVAAERRLVAPGLLSAEYDLGTARVDNELVIVGTGRVLMEAQHATSPVRKKTGLREAPDHGTAGIGYVLAEDGYGRVIIPTGRQTSNANTDPDHPIKAVLLDELKSGGYEGVFSIHGCKPGKVTSLADNTEIHAVIGLGLEPRDIAYDAAERLVREAKEQYGLRVVIGNVMPHVNFAENPEAGKRDFWDLSEAVARTDTGEVAAGRVAGVMRHSTVSFVTRETTEAPDMPVLQLEMSRSLRLTPRDQWVRPDLGAEKAGVHLGYCLSRLAAEVCVDLGR